MTTAHLTTASAPACKTAISVPPSLLRAVDAAARRRGESRSRFIQAVLAAAVRARRDSEIRRRIDALFAGEVPRKTQRREARALEMLHGWDREAW
jgi:metal-responsive CopG/Arc/MetJ family transcriptional regulator